MARTTKRMRALRAKVDRTATCAPAEAFALLKELATAKFDESVEVHLGLGIDARKGDQQVRATAVLPHGTGKTVRIGVITQTQQEAARTAGASIVGGEDLIAAIGKGDVIGDVDVLVATPEMMPQLAAVARILGPRGLMPNPKAGTVTQDVTATVGQLQKGQVDFRNDKTGNIHQIIGKISFPTEHLVANYEALLAAVDAARPSGYKGELIRRIAVCTTMSPAVWIKKR